MAGPQSRRAGGLTCSRASGTRLTANLDGTLVLLAVLILSVGLFTLYSAAYDSPGRLNAQIVNIAVAFAAMWIAAQIPPQTLMRFAVPIYVVGLCLLVAVALFGEVVNGARRWLHVGVLRFQPSEMMKIAMPLMLAWYFQKRETTLKVRDYVLGGGDPRRCRRCSSRSSPTSVRRCSSPPPGST